MGHYVGGWRATPFKRPELKIHWFKHAIMGEISSDLLLAKCAPELLEVSLTNLLGKIFFYARKGFSLNQYCGTLNEDNDVWGGVYFLRELLDHKVIQEVGRSDYHFELDKLIKTLIFMSDEVENLGKSIIKEESKDTQEQILRHWMASKIEMDKSGFVFDEQIKEMFSYLVPVKEMVS